MSNKSQKKCRKPVWFLPDVEYLENYFALFDFFDADAQKSMPYRLEGLMFVATVCGTCHFTVDLKEHILHPNELLLVLPGQMVQHVDKSADFQGRFMFMSSELLANISTRKKIFRCFRPSGQPADTAQALGHGEMFLQYHDFIRKGCRIPLPSSVWMWYNICLEPCFSNFWPWRTISPASRPV